MITEHDVPTSGAPVQKENQMSQSPNTELLLMSIFQEAHEIYNYEERRAVNATEYLKHCASDIERIGRVFKCLGLAVESTQSSLGWKPTARLIRIIGKRSARPSKASKKIATEKDRNLVDLLFQAAGESKESEITDDFCFSVLNALGFLREGRGGGCKPTSLLKKLILDDLE